MNKPADQRKPGSARLIELKRRAKRQGWLKHLRQGPGEEADEKALLAGCEFDVARADHVCDFFEEYGVLTEGPWAGQAFELLDWQREWLSRCFGWVRYSDQWGAWVRRFRYVYLEVPKKNGKTPMAATLGNYLLFADAAHRQVNLFLAATTKTQANRCLKHAIRAYKFREALAEAAITKKLEGFDSVEYNDNLWQVVAADAASADGVNGHVIGDEIHRWIGHEFFNTLRWALASQPEGLFLGITTAGSDPESVCRSCHDKTVAVNAGRLEQQDWFGTIYAAAVDADPDDEATWLDANPSLGTDPSSPLKLEAFRADYESAKVDPAQWPIFLQLRLNIWRNSVDSWIDINRWDLGEVLREEKVQDAIDQHEERRRNLANKKTPKKPNKRIKFKPPRMDCFEPFDFEKGPGGVSWKDLNGVMAFDAATVRDTSSAVFTFEHPTDEGALVSYPFYWMPKSRAEELQKRIPFQAYADAGYIDLTEGDAVDFNFMLVKLIELVRHFGVDEFYYDPNFQAEWVTERLAYETGADRVAFGQTMSNFSPPMKTAERLILEKKWRHNGHPIFTWQLGNLKAKHDANQNIRPVKQKHGDWRTVDGPVCGIMTIAKWTVDDGDDDDDDFMIY